MADISELELQNRIEKAAYAIRDATALLFTSGAGLGVDSGLPDFRGPEGFWRAYPPIKALGLEFPMMSNPVWFKKDPSFAWGFWAHRFKLYNNAVPHYGYEVMKRLGQSKLNKDGYFVFTSNVDGGFEKAGFDTNRIIECHGSVHWLQCTEVCSKDIWSSQNLVVDVNETTFKAAHPLPKCIHCDKLARPNVLMFYDNLFSGGRWHSQEAQYSAWKGKLTEQSKLVVIEVGAGTAVPTIRRESERSAYEQGDWQGTLIRINLRDTAIPAGGILLPIGGKDALTRIEAKLNSL